MPFIVVKRRDFKRRTMENNQENTQFKFLLLKFLFMFVIFDLECLHDNFSDKTLQRMMYDMEEMVLSEGEIIFLDKQVDDLSLYFIVKGGVDLFYECYRSYDDRGTVVKSLKTQDECFGEFGFFTGMCRQVSAKSTAYTTLYKIRRENFLQIVDENDEDFENFHMIKDKLLQSTKQEMVNIFCDICGRGIPIFQIQFNLIIQ
uniref:CAP family transcription factor n=1 Tax=Philasterides dicentrarchi TaxID=282688 RepID=A0A059T2G3_9CILI|nr:CAP family transcription factor [Philasterides dicentrarchi]